jgi:hypothetical protein
MEPVWYEFDREAAAVETLEHAIDLFDAGKSPQLVLSVGHEAWQYFAERARPGKKGRGVKVDLVEVLKAELGEGFDPTWVRQRADDVFDDIGRYEMRRSPAPLVRISARTPICLLLCAIGDCRKATGRVSEKLQHWRDRQVERALQDCLFEPEVAARSSTIRAASKP